MHLVCVNKMTKHLAEIGVVKKLPRISVLALEKKKEGKKTTTTKLSIKHFSGLMSHLFSAADHQTRCHQM